MGDVESPYRLEGASALVTGASRGIGRAVAVALARAGASVALLARDAGRLGEVRAEIAAVGGRALAVPCDLESPGAVAEAMALVLVEFPDLSIVVNNAGGMSHVGPFLASTEDDWAGIWSGNVTSAVRVLRHLGPHLVARGGGAVVNMSSVAGLAGVPMLSHYGATKAALISLTRTLAVEWAPHGVRVNALAPGWVTTDLTGAFSGDPGLSAALTGDVPQHRWGGVEEVAHAAVFLAGEAASFITGACLTLDGGLLAQPGGAALTGLLPLGRTAVR
ncbi:2-deoxy-D-gluconate 3-dehydrogenase [Actinorhabdospora filicis]|uniref:2-deoxy-D-gluconate 3-dehydrogenase n=1 Tax=Actinorhabdospora filicis TaxID=1785913 RepID=A0A9W6SNH5_9ACTN|nr:SDR family oxidoreductase [Actinorhabdospora filicis]GLZ77831.1 2-deoxy-D-gluconate 3-dehydrogenase [Actinorhabdospora filicis]